MKSGLGLALALLLSAGPMGCSSEDGVMHQQVIRVTSAGSSQDGTDFADDPPRFFDWDPVTDSISEVEARIDAEAGTAEVTGPVEHTLLVQYGAAVSVVRDRGANLDYVVYGRADRETFLQTNGVFELVFDSVEQLDRAAWVGIQSFDGNLFVKMPGHVLGPVAGSETVRYFPYPYQSSIIDASKGDRAWVTLEAAEPFEGRTVAWILDQVGAFPPLEIESSKPNYALMPDFQPVDRSRNFEAVLDVGGLPSGAPRPPAATLAEVSVLTQPGDPGVGIHHQKAIPLANLTGFDDELGQRQEHSLTYGMPFPDDWTVYGAAHWVEYVAYGGTVSSPRIAVGAWWYGAVEDLSGKALEPPVTPPRDLRVDGVSASAPVQLESMSPAIQWAPPEGTIPDFYRVDVYTVGSDDSYFVASLYTDTNGIKMPPGFLEEQLGMNPRPNLVFRVTAIIADGDFARRPFVLGFPASGAAALTETVTLPL